MTKDEAFNKLFETVETVGSGKFKNVEQALVVASQAINYLMDNIDNIDDDVPLSASQIRKEVGVTQRDRQIARAAAKRSVEGTDDNQSS